MNAAGLEACPTRGVMNPGLVVKLRPTGPWRIGSDSGARNRVDAIYHSDALYSAVTSAMARLGSLDEWLDATARDGSGSAVCFSSCFPFLDEIGLIVPPRTVWPPASPAMSARVRWKSARFVPLGVVQAILAGRKLDENQWAVDGPSECLVPAGRPGPFRTSLRWCAAVDRLTGATERHSTACTEFRPGSGLWTIVAFAGDAARDQWQEPVKAAFRLLADSGFGGERSRGWGRSEAPEFIEGTLPDMILGGEESQAQGLGTAGQAIEAGPQAPALIAPPEPAPEEPAGHEIAAQGPAAGGQAVEAEPEAPAVLPPSEPAPEEIGDQRPEAGDRDVEAEPAITNAEAPPESEPEPPVNDPQPEPPIDDPPAPESPIGEPEPTEGEASVEAPSEIAPLAATPEPEAVPEAPAPEPESPERSAAPESPATSGKITGKPHWLLSVFNPAAADAVDWTRGNYALLVRGGRVESPAGSGEPKKQVQMVAEGSVLFAAAGLRGSAPDVAPDGFAHPVYRAGFALAIPLPEGR